MLEYTNDARSHEGKINHYQYKFDVILTVHRR